MRVKSILWVIAFAFFVATVIDAFEGYVPKLINSLLLMVAFIFLATGYGRKDQKKLFAWGYGLLIMALIVLVYRLMTLYSISN